MGTVIGRLPGRVVVLAVVTVFAAVVALGAASLDKVTSLPPYLLALLLAVVTFTAVLVRWPAGRERAVATGVAVAVVAIGLLVVPSLVDGRPGYALWYPAFVWLPLCGLALRGFPVLAVGGALASAATTVAWAWQEPLVDAVEDGLYRVVSPTAVVVVAVGISLLMQQYGREVERAHAEQLEAARLSAGAQAAEQERRHHLSQVEQIAAPVLQRLAAGDPVDQRLATECRLLEAAVRDGIRGRHLVDPAVRDSVWAARTRGVEVTLLDDSGTDPGQQPPAAALSRRCLVELLEKVESGKVTARLAGSGATLVLITPDAAEVARSCRAFLTGRDDAAAVELEPVHEGEDEMVVTIRPVSPA